MIKYTLNNYYNELSLFDKDVKKLVKKVSKILKIKDKLFFEISIVDKEQIRDINNKYRNKNLATDVISFSFNDNTEIKSNLIGEIFICYEKILDQANEYHHSIKREYLFLITHGLLHLLGYDHIKKEDEEKMFSLQDEILNKLKIKIG